MKTSMRTSIKMLVLGGLVLGICSSTQATLVNFDALKTDPLLQGGYAHIPDGYGSTPHVDVSYQTVNPDNNTQYSPYMHFWPGPYGDLPTVAYSDQGNYQSEVTLTPKPGYQVTLVGFDLAAWTSSRYASVIDVLGGATPVHFGGMWVTGQTHDHFNVNVTSSGPLSILFGPDGWNVGINNIEFDVTPVPEPSTCIAGALLLLPFGLQGIRVLRNRK